MGRNRALHLGWRPVGRGLLPRCLRHPDRRPLHHRRPVVVRAGPLGHNLASTGEVAPTWSVGGGQASATAAQKWFGFLISSAAPTTPQATAVVDVKALDSGATNHYSAVFVGLVKDSSDYIMVWYSTYYHTSGEDLVLNGVLQPAGFQVACCADVILQPGDRFAFALDGNTVTSYYQANGSGPWTELESTSVAPLLDLTNPATLAEYHFAFGLRW